MGRPAEVKKRTSSVIRFIWRGEVAVGGGGAPGVDEVADLLLVGGLRI